MSPGLICRRIVGIGLSNGLVARFDRFPGWENGSWGYHGDGGQIFKNSGYGQRYCNEKYGKGDTVGCGVDLKRRIFFTKNGRHLGTFP